MCPARVSARAVIVPFADGAGNAPGPGADGPVQINGIGDARKRTRGSRTSINADAEEQLFCG